MKYQVTDMDLDKLKSLLMRGTEENLLLKLFFQTCFKEWARTLNQLPDWATHIVDADRMGAGFSMELKNIAWQEIQK